MCVMCMCVLGMECVRVWRGGGGISGVRSRGKLFLNGHKIDRRLNIYVGVKLYAKRIYHTIL